MLTALVCVVFLVVGVGRMLRNHLQYGAEDFLQPRELLAAREALSRAPRDADLKEQIRTVDLELRRRYFRHIRTNVIGAWLLTGAGVLLVVSARAAVAARQGPPGPRPATTEERDPRLTVARCRWAVAGVAVAVGVGLLAYGMTIRPRLPTTADGLKALLAGTGMDGEPEVGPRAEEVRASWPQFRGPRGDGVAEGTNAPLAWNGATGEGILWKAAVPAPGHNSPVVWSDRVFLTGGTAEARHVMCFDGANGGLLWDKVLPPPPGGFPKKPEAPEYTGFAASTAATDGRRVFAIFATGELVAYDFGGRLVWSKPLGMPENMYGHATSLVCWQGLLLVQFDQGEAEAGKSRLYGLDARSGEPRWEVRRQVPSSWTTPVVIEVAGRTQVIAMAEPWVMSYDPVTGTELWRADCLGSDLAPSPVLVGPTLVVVSPGREVVGLRADGQGDVTKSHLLWRYDENTPDITSPVGDGELVYVITTSGVLFCLEAATGQRVWEHELELEFNASPVRVGQRIYLMDTKGATIVVETGRTYREVGRAQLGEEVHASPAFVGGRIYVRGKDHLYCVGGGATLATN